MENYQKRKLIQQLLNKIMTKQKNTLPSNKNIDDFELLEKMLDALACEFRELSKKKQEGVLNLTKVKMVNRILKPLKENLLINEPSQIFLDLLDENEIPNNSDVVLIISQYEKALSEFEDKYHISDPNNSYKKRWSTKEDPVEEWYENDEEESDGE
jgi:hypothetical protein